MNTWVGLVEIMIIIDKSRSDVFKNDRCIRTNEHGNTAAATSWSSVAFGIDCDIGGYYNTIAA
jgi:hypothetical protein